MHLILTYGTGHMAVVGTGLVGLLVLILLILLIVALVRGV